MRAGLTDAQFRNLRTQGELITNLLIETGTRRGRSLIPYVNEPAVRAVLHRILPPIAEGERPGVGHPRVRVFAADGATDRRQRRASTTASRKRRCRESANGRASAERSSAPRERVEYLRLTPWRPTITLAEERARALRGEIARGERLNEARRARGVGDAAAAARAGRARHGHHRKRRRRAHPGGRARRHDPVRARRERSRSSCLRCCWRCSSPGRCAGWRRRPTVCA